MFSPAPRRTGVATALRVYLRPNVAVFLPLGFASGLPLLLTAGTLFTWMAEVEVNLTTIGLFALVGIPYSFKFAWSPLVDRLALPFFTSRFGQRRGWLLVAQAGLVLALILLAHVEPASWPVWTALLAVMVAFLSATQDIAMDAFRIELQTEDELASGAAVYVYGYRIALLVAGAGALYIAEFAGWRTAYLSMAALVPLGMVAVLLRPEPDHKGRELLTAAESRANTLRAWMATAVIAPFREFMSRNGWLIAFSFAALYKFGDALAGTMTNPFLIQLGFTKVEIANVAKIFGFWATMGGLALGGILNARIGLIATLWIAGILQMGSNLMFAVQAAAGADVSVLAATIGIENLAGGMGTAAFIAYLSRLCDIRYTATQYAVLTSCMALARTLLSSPAGWLVENVEWSAYWVALVGPLAQAWAGRIDWIGFFVMTTFAALPGLVLLARLSMPSARHLLSASRA